MPKQTPPRKDDIEINQIALSTAQFQNVARSWLNDAFGSEDTPANEDELDSSMLQPEAEGVGYVDHSDNRFKKQSAATEALRKQMLGKRAKDFDKRTPRELTASKPKTMTANRKEESDEEEEGRSALGKNRKNNLLAERTTSGSTPSGTSVPLNPKKRGTSYLDEVLAQRTAKKKSRK